MSKPASKTRSTARTPRRPARRGPVGARVAPRLFLVLLVLVFVVSGAAGLIYESIWSRYLGLLVGHSAYAQSIVLVIFMGGMAAGALAVGRRSERIRRPLLAYAWVEAAIGLIGLAFHPVYVAATRMAYDTWFPALGETVWLPIVKWGLSGLLILPQSVLLGATFPLMSAGVVRRLPQAPGRIVSLLYFANSLGASIGVLGSGFWLVAAVGLPGTVMTAAILNLVVAAIVVGAERTQGKGRADPDTGAGGSAGAGAAPGGGNAWQPRAAAREAFPGWLPRLLLAVSFGTAAASFAYEIAWIRMLSLVLGSATHSFELMLSAFILGIALGALWTRTRADRFARPMRALGIAQWVMGALALATLPLYMQSFHWMSGLVTALSRAPKGYEIFSLARYGICLAVMLPATFCAGVTLPLITRILMTSGTGERAIGAVYGANTLGSIVGAALAGLVLLPWLGLKGLLVSGATLDIALGVALFATEGGREMARRWVLAAAGAAVIVVGGIAAFVKLDRLVLASGVYRGGFLLDPAETRVIFYRDGRTATVSVRQQTDGGRTLSTNGKPDASVTARWFTPERTRHPEPLNDDESTQILLPLVALAHAPRAAQAAVIGQGSGMTTHVLLGSPHLARVVTIEIEPEMIRASRDFYPANRRAFDDPRAAYVVDDARSYFAATQEGFDLIVSEPSNPWVSGVSGLFTDEFYRRVRGALRDGGVLGQWLHLYSLTDALALSVLAAIHRNFNAYQVYLVSSSDVLIVATNRAADLAPDWSVARFPAIASELRFTQPFTPDIFDALRVADRATLGPLLERTAPNSDFHPLLDLGAERARFFNLVAAGLMRLSVDRFGIAAARSPRVTPPASSDLPLPGVLRVRSLMWVARLRAALAGDVRRPGDGPELTQMLGEALERQRRLSAPASGSPPANWRAWLLDAIRADDELHRGTSAYADEDFFPMLRRSVAAAHAPAPVAAAVEWLDACERRDLPRVASGADAMVAAAVQDTPWVPAEMVLYGGTAARLLTGDVSGARRVFGILRPVVGRRPTDLRIRILEAQLAAAEDAIR